MNKKLVIVPKNESYYFCKRIFFSIFGEVCNCFADCLNLQGWVCYPSYKESNDPDVLLFSKSYNFSYMIKLLDDSDTGKIYTNYRLGILITDKQDISDSDKEFFNEIIDISSLKDYYETELNLDQFIEKLYKLE